MNAPRYVVLLAVVMSAGIVTGCSSSSSDGPSAVAKKTFTAYSKGDYKTACGYIEPDQRARCLSSYSSGSVSGQNIAVHKTVISGDRALVSITGTICVSGACQTITDATAGMPTQGVTFDQAWSTETGSNAVATDAATPLKRISGKWYVVVAAND